MITLSILTIIYGILLFILIINLIDISQTLRKLIHKIKLLEHNLKKKD